MGLLISNLRQLLKRSTTPGVVPTIPSSGVTSQTEPDKTWAPTDIMIGELFMNTADSKIWFRSDTGIYELGYSGQTGYFTALADTPNTIIPGQYLVGNSAGTALTFSTGMTDTNRITMMEDFYPKGVQSGYEGYSIVYDGVSGFTYKLIDTKSFTGLTDVNTPYTNAYDLIRVNSTIDGLEFFKGSDYYVDINTTQTINSNKIFNNTTTFNNGINVNNNITFTGTTYTVSITNISTDTGFTIVNDNTLATTRAIFYWVNSLIMSGTTGITSMVTLNTDQTITGNKTFNGTTNFVGTSSANTLYINNLYVDDDIYLKGTIYLNDTILSYIGYNQSNQAIITSINDNRVLTVEQSKVYLYKDGPVFRNTGCTYTIPTINPTTNLNTGLGGLLYGNEMSLICNQIEIQRLTSSNTYFYKPVYINSNLFVTGNTTITQELIADGIRISRPTSSGGGYILMYDMYDNTLYSLRISGGTLIISPEY